MYKVGDEVKRARAVHFLIGLKPFVGACEIWNEMFALKTQPFFHLQALFNEWTGAFNANALLFPHRVHFSILSRSHQQ